MTAYNEILDTTVDPESPLTTTLATRFRDNPIAIAEQSSGAPTLPSTRIYHVQEQKATNTASASAPSTSAPARRDLVEVVDTLGDDGSGGGSVGGTNDTQITLPAGTYLIFAKAKIELAASSSSSPFSGGNLKSRLDLYRTSGTPAREIVGDTSYNTLCASSITESSLAISNVDFNMESYDFLTGVFNITSSSVFELRHYASTTSTGGSAVNFGSEVEIYTDAIFYQLDLTG